MKLGMALRNMGPQATLATLVDCARAAEAANIDDLWVADHVAIPPDDAEGSGGRYLDPLATLAFLAGVTSRIGLGTGVLILPYRPALATAKWVATIQELSAGRLQLGVGVGWMAPEFRALGVSRAHRGAITDTTLDVIHRCFASDQVELNGQPFLFLPRPSRPPIFVGGAPPHALRRTVRFGDGWIPIARDPEKLRPAIVELQDMAAAAQRPVPQVVVMTSLALSDPSKAAAQAHALAEAGATGVVHVWRYGDAAAFSKAVESLRTHVRPAVPTPGLG